MDGDVAVIANASSSSIEHDFWLSRQRPLSCTTVTSMLPPPQEDHQTGHGHFLSSTQHHRSLAQPNLVHPKVEHSRLSLSQNLTCFPRRPQHKVRRHLMRPGKHRSAPKLPTPTNRTTTSNQGITAKLDSAQAAPSGIAESPQRTQKRPHLNKHQTWDVDQNQNLNLHLHLQTYLPFASK